MRKFSLLIYVSIIFINCEDPIDISLNDTKEILVVEAFINWIKENKTTEQVVNLSLSSPYFNTDFKADFKMKSTIDFNTNFNAFVALARRSDCDAIFSRQFGAMAWCQIQSHLSG